MSSNNISHGVPQSHEATSQTSDSGGSASRSGSRRTFRGIVMVIRVAVARLRFIAILAVIGLILLQWDRLTAEFEKWTRPKNAAAASSDYEFFCPMHPTIVRDTNKEKCPICFMPLSKRKKGATSQEALPPGVVNRVQLSPYRVVLAGVQTYQVRYVELTKEIQAVGYFEFNERNQRTVSSRVQGRIDSLFVNETGKMVSAGDPLTEVYSPEFVVSVSTLQEAAKTGNTRTVETTRRRLELLGIDTAQIDQLQKSDSQVTHVTVRSPIAGHVIRKYVREGQYVDEGAALYDVADLSSVWIQAPIYEDDLAFLPLAHQPKGETVAFQGPEVTATTRMFPNESFHGRLTFIYPHADLETRTVTVRFEVENPDHKLRPGGTATVILKIAPQDVASLTESITDLGQRQKLSVGLLLAVPEASVIDTGNQTIVYRETLPGVFEGVEVKLGPKMVDAQGIVFYPVLSGLREKEKIVTSGSFLVDAETRLNPAVGSIYFGGGEGGKNAVGTTTIRATTPEDPDAKINAALDQLSPEERAIAEAQKFCPVLAGSRLGSMGVPVKVMLLGKPVFLCCSGCESEAVENPEKTLRRAEELKAENSGLAKPAAPPTDEASLEEARIQSNLAKLTDADRQLATKQRFCPVLEDSRLGSMGAPVKIELEGETAFLCCEACRDSALEDPKATLAKVKTLIEQGGGQ